MAELFILPLIQSTGLQRRDIQSLLNSSALRRRMVMRRSVTLRERAEVWTLDGGSGDDGSDIRLQGLYSRQAGQSRGLVVLLHGWEGSVNSNYILANGARLFDASFDVFQLNFRDHGDTHQRLAPLKIPSTLLTSVDDPVVPVADFEDILDNPALELIISPYGGHCGFLKNWKLESLAEDLIVQRFLDAP